MNYCEGKERQIRSKQMQEIQTLNDRKWTVGSLEGWGITGEIGKCCISLCPASPILICCPGLFVEEDGCYVFFPISKFCHHDFDRNDFETEGGFRNCGHFHKMRSTPQAQDGLPEPGYGSVHMSCAPFWFSLIIYSPWWSWEGLHILLFLPDMLIVGTQQGYSAL